MLFQQTAVEPVHSDPHSEFPEMGVQQHHCLPEQGGHLPESIGRPVRQLAGNDCPLLCGSR